MTFNLIETSIDLGKPVRLYLFERGLLRWGYCTADRNVTYASQLYRTLQISDNNIRQSGEPSADAFEVTVPAGIEVAELYRGIGPSSDIILTVRDMHYGDTEAIIGYVGAIQTVQFPAEDRAVIVCNSDAISLNQIGLRLTWGRGCPHVLYERGCYVNRDLYKVESSIQSMNGVRISNGAFAGYSDGWFNGGYVEWAVGTAQYDRRAIESHTNSDLVLLGGTQGLALAMDVTAFPGCDRIIQTCHDKFGNVENYGGQPHQPGKNPFDSSPIF